MLKISIFPSVNPLPQSKEEKKTESFKASAPYKPEVKTVATEAELIETVTNYAWSPAVFDGTRKAENFVSCDFLVYDIDEGMTIDQADAIVTKLGLCCLCLPSPSHTELSHRFRLIFPLATSITDIESFDATWQEGAKHFSVDEQCSDSCRFYFGSTQNDGFWIEGKFFEPVTVSRGTEKLVHNNSNMLIVGDDIKATVEQIYGEPRTKVPEVVDHFIRNAHTGLKGSWVNSLNAFCFSLALTGVHNDVIVSACETLAPETLDKKDRYQINRAIKDGERMR